MKIAELQIFTSRPEEQKKFYRDTLGLEVLKETKDTFEIKLGFSLLKFTKKAGATPYHIAFHIQDRQEKQALEWLKERVEIQKSGKDEIVDFSNWDAKSVYFYDEDGTILEFISRRNFNKADTCPFTAEKISGISEIGLATLDIKEKYDFLQRNCGLEMFDGSLQKFCAIGDPQGLIITIDRAEKKWFPVDDKAYSSDFSIKFTHQNSEFHLEYKDDHLEFIK
ncbi:VOC family protein [Zunongwangia sp. F363]|uniref:VOC family protein n=1 Tax=Autumnicola tepida TaxID=3075595 RepID=A0ABU3CDI0_9FLAO|nr:VOC family protein [Zunongwangia sp. F363]MDT0644366.1 VOC family protein [Zunongwangia sp. F363]